MGTKTDNHRTKQITCWLKPGELTLLHEAKDIAKVSLSHLLRFSVLNTAEGQRILRDYRICDKKILQPHEQIIRKTNKTARIVWISGNHENRCSRWLNCHQQATGMIEPEIRTYDRNTYATEKRDALDKWASHIKVAVGQATGANVTALRKGG